MSATIPTVTAQTSKSETPPELAGMPGSASLAPSISHKPQLRIAGLSQVVALNIGKSPRSVVLRGLLVLVVLIFMAMMAVVTLPGFAHADAVTGPAASAPGQVGGQKSAGGGDSAQAPLCDPNWVVVDDSSLYDSLYDVAVVSADDIWAVGLHHGSYGTPPEQTLVEHWDGSAWSVVSSPNPGMTTSILYGVAVGSAGDVWAVGYYANGGSAVRLTLTEHWNGSAWSVVPSPNVGAGNNSFNAVAVGSATDVWAVGSYIDSTAGGEKMLSEHWDGSSWTIVPCPDHSADYNVLSGVTIISPNDVWAVGSYGQSRGRTLVEHWDGTSWTFRFSPDPGAGSNALYDIAAISTNDVWAVGTYWSSIYGQPSALIEHWDGSNWSLSPTPVPGTANVMLKGITAISANDIWAVGGEAASSSQSLSIIEHWDGSSWSLVPSQSPGTYRSFLYGVSAVSAGDVWAVGEQDSGQTRPLLERYNPCPPTPVPTPTPCTAGSFSDVPPDSTFYPFVSCLAGRGIIGGYSDCTFRPGNNVTRGQLSKIVSNAADFQEDPGAQIYEDVPLGSTFYQWINRLSNRGFMGGYACGGPGEPCGNGNKPYFRPGANASRGQTSKIVSNAAGYIDNVTGQIFEDVPPVHTFYAEIQRLASRGIMQGYPCGSVGEPCGPNNLPYFRPQDSVTRGQSAKIVSNTFFPGCVTPTPTPTPIRR